MFGRDNEKRYLRQFRSKYWSQLKFYCSNQMDKDEGGEGGGERGKDCMCMCVPEYGSRGIK